MDFSIFHQVERYHIAREVIRCLRGKKTKCKILEVGAGKHGNSARYFPNDEVLFTDVIYTDEDMKDPRFMLADATDLPFQDNAFDFVIGLDVLEHVHPEKRANLLHEVYRVAQVGVFLSFPHASKRSHLNEQLKNIYISYQKEPPIWLQEHDEMGLPQFDDIYKMAIQSISLQHVFSAHAVDYELNRMLLRMEAYTSCNPSLTDVFIQLNNAYVEDVLVHDLGGCLENTVKSYLVLSRLPLNASMKRSLQGIFSKLDMQVVSSFKKRIVNQFKEWMKAQATLTTKEDNSMRELNTMTALLEMIDRADQIMEKMNQQMDIVTQQSVADREFQQHIVDVIKEDSIARQVNCLMKSIEQSASQQMQMMMNLSSNIEDDRRKTEAKMKLLAQEQLQEMQAIRESITQEAQQRKAEEDRIIMNVILITYNQEKYIKTTLKSILDQITDFSFNIIVADDCSKDNTMKIIREMEKHTDIPFVYLDDSRNHGIMQNYKRAFAACNAEYVAIMEGDDIWTDPYRLQKHKNFLENHLECAMSFNQFVVKDFKKGTAEIMPRITHEHFDTYRVFSGADLAYDNLIGNFSTCVYKNAYLQRLPQKLYDVHAYDWLTNIFISRMGLVGCLLQPMSIYRIHSGGTWSQKSQQDKLKEIIDLISVYDELTDHEFTLGFTAHRNRLEAQLQQIEGLGMFVPATAPTAEQPVSTIKQKGVMKYLKKVCVKLRDCIMRTLDCLPPMVTMILKWLVPPVIVRKIKNVKEG